MKKMDEAMVGQVVDRDGLLILESDERLIAIREAKKEAWEAFQVLCAEEKTEEEKRQVPVDNILNLMTPPNMKRVLAHHVIVECGRNINPTITAPDLDIVPPEFIICRPKLDKRGIQSYITKMGNVPVGVTIEYKQRLKVMRRHNKTEE